MINVWSPNSRQEVPRRLTPHSFRPSIRAIFSNDFSDHWFIERHQRLRQTVTAGIKANTKTCPGPLPLGAYALTRRALTSLRNINVNRTHAGRESSSTL